MNQRSSCHLLRIVQISTLMSPVTRAMKDQCFPDRKKSGEFWDELRTQVRKFGLHTSVAAFYIYAIMLQSVSPWRGDTSSVAESSVQTTPKCRRENLEIRCASSAIASLESRRKKF